MGNIAHQAIHSDKLGLAQAVTPVLGLPIYLRVEVNIMQDDCICPCQVEPLTPSSGAQQEGKYTLVGIVEPAHADC